MIGRTNAGGGGSSLNYTVVGGTTAPTNPKENTVWVNTDTAITSYVFSVTEPESPAEGMVWIVTSASANAPFNAIKKNGLWVYPAGAQQYINGSWVTKIAQAWQSGEWVVWDTFFYNHGDENVGLTGGWVWGGGTYDYTEHTASITREKRDDSLYLKMYRTNSPADSSGVASAWTSQSVNLERISTLVAEVSSVDANTEPAVWGKFFCVFDARPTDDFSGKPYDFWYAHLLASVIIQPGATRVSLDVSGISSAFIALQNGAYGNDTTTSELTLFSVEGIV